MLNRVRVVGHTEDRLADDRSLSGMLGKRSLNGSGDELRETRDKEVGLIRLCELYSLRCSRVECASLRIVSDFGSEVRDKREEETRRPSHFKLLDVPEPVACFWAR